MARETTVKGRVGFLQRVLARLTSNRAELQHVEPTRALLEGLFGQIQDAADRQAFHTAAKQEASQQLQTLLTEAERLVNILLLAVKQHYGIRAEKLADFGLKPFRGRTRSASTKPVPEPPAPKPEPTVPEPATPPVTLGMGNVIQQGCHVSLPEAVLGEIAPQSDALVERQAHNFSFQGFNVTKRVCPSDRNR